MFKFQAECPLRGSPPYLVSGSGLVQLDGVVLHVVVQLGHLVGRTEGLGAA